MNNFFLKTTLAVIPVLFAASSAVAEVSIKGGLGGASSPSDGAVVVTTDQVVTARDVRKSGSGYTLRCWHAGRMVYESVGLRGEAEKSPDVIRIPRQGGDVVSVMSLKDGLCILF